jgi:FAD:protein FMN transferase
MRSPRPAQAIAPLVLFFVSGVSGAERYRASEPHMGSIATITLYASTSEEAELAFRKAFARIAELNSIFSDYNEDSELSRFCESRKPPSKDLATVLEFAHILAVETDGAFDITAGALTEIWRSARKANRLPTRGEIGKALLRVGYRKLRGTTCAVSGLRLDAGGIAKGYAADEALVVLRDLGIRRALVAMSGDIAVGDPPPGRGGWKVSVADKIVTLKNSSVSTSGDEFQGHTIEGIRYSHIVDPRTGWALRNSDPVAVIADTAMEADAIATAFSVAGPKEALTLARKRGVKIITKR